jgi:hypothetical protein
MAGPFGKEGVSRCWSLLGFTWDIAFNCRRPTYVGEFKLHGWQHAFNMCQSCLEGLNAKVGAEVSLHSIPQLTAKKEN